MSSPESRIVDLAENGKLEVEDLLDLAFVGDIRTADFLQELRGRWESQGEVGFAGQIYKNWALVVEQFLRDGFPGLSKLSKGEGASFVIALLEHLHCKESVLSLMDIFSYVIDNCEEYAGLADKVVTSINAILSFPPIVTIDQASMVRLRGFVHRYIEIADSVEKYATAICALRAFGDQTSIDLIKSQKPLSGSWAGTEKIVIKKINDNLKKRANR